MQITLSSIINHLLHIFPIKKRKIMFMCHWGSRYDCNPKYLSKYIVEHCPEWDVVWAFENPEKYDIKGVRIVRFPSARYFYELSTCRVFVTNLRMLKHFQKRKGQTYIQTWHSSFRLKHIEKDAVKTLPAGYVRDAKRDSLQTSLLISGCQKSTEIFRRCFWYEGPILSSGTPRNDYLINSKEEEKDRVREILGFVRNKRILLYAPTFRKDFSSLDVYNLNLSALKDLLNKLSGEDWLILMRLHPNITNLSHHIHNEDPNIINVSKHDDIQELLLLADIVVTDYSSLMFDFALTKRPCFLYIPDYDLYTKTDRGLYLGLEELPFPIAKSNQELFDILQDFSLSNYKSRLEDFLKSIGSYETGHACEKVVNYINNNIK